MSGIDESFIEEAKPKRKPSSRTRWIRIGTLAAMLAIVVCALGAWLLIPFSTDPTSAIREYRGSEYYPVIEKLNGIISQIGQEFGLEYVLNTDNNACPYIDKNVGMDITNLVRERCNQAQ